MAARRQSMLRKNPPQQKLTPTRANRKLPEHVVNFKQLEDLRTAWQLYETEENKNQISMSQVRGILWNFGFWRMTKQEFEQELENHNISTQKSHLDFKELLEIVTDRYYRGGLEQEIKDTFRIFDKKDRGQTNLNDIKTSLQSRLDVPVTEQEVLEMFEIAGLDPQNPLSYDDFVAM